MITLTQVDINDLFDRWKDQGVLEVEEVVGVWEFRIDKCPINLKIKVVQIAPQGMFIGITNYSIQSSEQATPYRSMGLCSNVEEALEHALNGFISFWDPKDADKTKFVLDKDF